MLYHQFPMLRILLPFIAGIAAAFYFPIPFDLLLISVLLVFAALILLFLIPAKKWKYRQKWILGAVFTLFFLIAGSLRLVQHRDILDPCHFSFAGKADGYIARVSEEPLEKEHSYKIILNILAIRQGTRERTVTGKLLAYLIKDTLSAQLHYGDRIVFGTMPVEVEPPHNPGQFNYKKYLSANNIYQQVYLKHNQWKKLNAESGFSVMGLATSIRHRFLGIFIANGLKGDEYKVASALILGQSDGLDAETLREYSGAGVMHILSVSGLHVGVIYIVLNFLLSFMDKRRKLLVIKTIVLIIVVWFYALITGLSPAVCRAAAMLSFIASGSLLKRRVHAINTLSVSAFLLIFLNPLIILNVGFQLSYAAVGGIVLIYDRLYRALDSRFWLTDQLWKMVALSISAQLATAPLSVYYFHQFPIYFLPANLIAVPLSSLAIYSGIIVLLTFFITPVSHLFGIITSWIIRILNWSVAFTESLPGSVWGSLNLSTAELLLLYAILAMILVFLATKNKQWIFGFTGLLLFFSISRANFAVRNNMQEKLIIFSVSKNSALAFRFGTQEILLADSSLLRDQKLLDMNVKNCQIADGIRNRTIINADSLFEIGSGVDFPVCGLQITRNRISYLDKKIVIVRQKLPPILPERKIRTDILLVKNSPGLKIADVLRIFDPGVIVFDESNPYWQVKKWQSECNTLQINSYSTRDKGAFILSM
jgi:competence protein ComEC